MARLGKFTYYGGNLVLMSGDTYELTFGDKPTYNARLVRTDGVSKDDFVASLSGAKDLESVLDSRALAHEVSNAVNSLAMTIVTIYVSLSALVSLLVLLNLYVMFVSEKKRELIVMMINGYSQKDTKTYVSRDSIIMNSLGMLVGCLFGTAMGIIAIESMKNSRQDFIAAPSPLAWIVGIALCTLFLAVVLRIALRRVDKFKLTSVND